MSEKTKMSIRLVVIGVLLSLLSCETTESVLPNASTDSIYFPPKFSNQWEKTSPSELQWNTEKLEELESFLINENSKSFMVLVNGRIVVESYFNGHGEADTWQWNSAGKTLVTGTVGIAQQTGLIDIENKVSTYIGQGWTSTTSQQENLITVKNLLSMNSGLDDEPQLVVKSKLTHVADAGKRWAYGNVFQRLMDVVEESSGIKFERYFENELADKIGMEGYWKTGILYRIFHSNTRSMARFGLLASQLGKWEGEQVIDENFFLQSLSPSQDINPSYGYLWWLNGKSKFMLPSSQKVFTGMLIPNAPNDMVAAMGKDEQRLYIVPSMNLVIVRMGEATTTGENFALSSFDNSFWERFNEVIQ